LESSTFCALMGLDWIVGSCYLSLSGAPSLSLLLPSSTFAPGLVCVAHLLGHCGVSLRPHPPKGSGSINQPNLATNYNQSYQNCRLKITANKL